MDIAVLSDIHGNYIALEKCIKHALDRNIKTFMFLGDYVGELAYPRKTMEFLYALQREYDCYFIKGNREDYWINYRKNGETGWKYGNSASGSLLYTYSHLAKEDLDFFESLSFMQVPVFEGFPALTICHGSPYRANEKLLPDDKNTYAIMEKDVNSFILCGHTHVQGQIEHAGKKVFNPGSVGVPLLSDGKTQFLILHGTNDSWQAEFVSLEYDVEKVICDLHAEKLDEKAPYWCKVSEHLLRTGKIAHGTVLEKAMELCREETGECKWPDIPEKYWEQAAVEMGIL